MDETSTEAEVERRLRLYIAATRVSRAVVRARSESELLREVVRVLVEDGKFAMSFYARHDPVTEELVPMARCGDTAAYSEQIRLFADERPEGQGPAGIAFRSGTPCICNDFVNDARTARWQEQARLSGWRASAAFPVTIGGKPHGILSVYAREENYFGADQVELLHQVALDLAFGLQRLAGDEQRRRAEAALLASEQRLALAVNAAAVGTFDWDLQTGEVVWGGNSEGMFGLARGEFDGTFAGFASRVHPEDMPKVHGVMEVSRATRKPFRQEFRIAWPDGSERWIFAQGEFHFNDSGEPCRMYGAALDVTERKRKEAALRESEERLRQAVRAADIGIFDHDHKRDTIYWSAQQRLIHGAGPDEVVSLQSFMGRVHPEDRENIGIAVRRAHDPNGDGLFDVEHRLLLPDGTVRWTSTKSQTFFEGEGDGRHPLRTVGAVRDITRQKLAEEEKTKLATLVEMSRDLFGIATLQGQVIYLNRAGLALVELESMDEARRKSIFDFFPEGERSEVARAMYAAVIESGYWCQETRLQNFKTGAPIDVEITAFQICDEVGTPLYVATSTRDITQRKKAEAEAAELEQRLFQASKMESIGRLAGGVAHDFNNMLTVINGQSQLVLSRMQPIDPLRHAVEEIHKAGERAAGLTRQLLAMSRKQLLQPQVLDVNRVVREMTPMLLRLLGESVELSSDLTADCGTVLADPNQLEQVILNLVVNARDAMPGGGKLSIESSCAELDEHYVRMHPEARAGRYVTLSVSDSGIGMDEKTKQHIFEPFFTTKAVGEGTGLGLATVQGVVAQSGGHINAYSEPGRGTTFKIYLPALAEEESEKALGVPAKGGAETILVVEDQAEVRKYAVAALESYGYRVLQSENAIKALEVCKQEGKRIDLVLSDVVMPMMSGPELAKRLESTLPGLKVLFMSGYTDNILALNGEFEEKFRFLQKPFSPDALANKVREVLSENTAAVTILVIDDEPEVRGYLRGVLEEVGYQVEEAADGADALPALQQQQVDLVIIDLVMPGQEGIETIQQLRKERPAVGIIAISGAFGGQYLKVAEMLGADAAIGKPMRAELLLEKVATVLKAKR